MKKLLVTGFEPFGGQKINPSQLILPELAAAFHNLSVLTLPVSFSQAFAEFKNHWNANSEYAGVLMLGQAVGRKAVSLERVALNWMQDKDVVSKRIELGGPEAVIVNLPLDEWKNALSQNGDVEISLTAGAYVCNYLYFRVLNEITKSKIPTLFVHLPMLPEQIQDQAAGPSMDFKIQKAIISKLISLLRN